MPRSIALLFVFALVSQFFFETMQNPPGPTTVSDILNESPPTFERRDVEQEEREPEKQNSTTVCCDFILAPSRLCKFGERCRERLQCSYIHTTERGFERSFCYCDDAMCVKPHPNRRSIKSNNNMDRKRKRLVCKNCEGDHLVTECPRVQCYKCQRFGHLANKCTLYR